MNIYLLATGVLSGFCALLHIFGGGKTVAAPLLAAQDIEQSPKYVNYYCWHLVTFNLAMMAVLFILVARDPSNEILGLLAVAQAGFYFLWGVLLPVWKKLPFKDVPQGWFFLPIFVVGILGL